MNPNRVAEALSLIFTQRTGREIKIRIRKETE